MNLCRKNDSRYVSGLLPSPTQIFPNRVTKDDVMIGSIRIVRWVMAMIFASVASALTAQQYASDTVNLTKFILSKDGSLGGKNPDATVVKINNLGWVLGYYTVSGGRQRTFVVTAGDAPEFKPDRFISIGDFFGTPIDFSEDGQVLINEQRGSRNVGMLFKYNTQSGLYDGPFYGNSLYGDDFLTSVSGDYVASRVSMDAGDPYSAKHNLIFVNNLFVGLTDYSIYEHYQRAVIKNISNKEHRLVATIPAHYYNRNSQINDVQSDGSGVGFSYAPATASLGRYGESLMQNQYPVIFQLDPEKGIYTTQTLLDLVPGEAKSFNVRTETVGQWWKPSDNVIKAFYVLPGCKDPITGEEDTWAEIFPWQWKDKYPDLNHAAVAVRQINDWGLAIGTYTSMEAPLGDDAGRAYVWKSCGCSTGDFMDLDQLVREAHKADANYNWTLRSGISINDNNYAVGEATHPGKPNDRFLYRVKVPIVLKCTDLNVKDIWFIMAGYPVREKFNYIPFDKVTVKYLDDGSIPQEEYTAVNLEKIWKEGYFFKRTGKYELIGDSRYLTAGSKFSITVDVTMAFASRPENADDVTQYRGSWSEPITGDNVHSSAPNPGCRETYDVLIIHDFKAYSKFRTNKEFYKGDELSEQDYFDDLLVTELERHNHHNPNLKLTYTHLSDASLLLDEDGLRQYLSRFAVIIADRSMGMSSALESAFIKAIPVLREWTTHGGTLVEIDGETIGGDQMRVMEDEFNFDNNTHITPIGRVETNNVWFVSELKPGIDEGGDVHPFLDGLNFNDGSPYMQDWILTVRDYKNYLNTHKKTGDADFSLEQARDKLEQLQVLFDKLVLNRGIGKQEAYKFFTDTELIWEHSGIDGYYWYENQFYEGADLTEQGFLYDDFVDGPIFRVEGNGSPAAFDNLVVSGVKKVGFEGAIIKLFGDEERKYILNRDIRVDPVDGTGNVVADIGYTFWRNLFLYLSKRVHDHPITTPHNTVVHVSDLVCLGVIEGEEGGIFKVGHIDDDPLTDFVTVSNPGGFRFMDLVYPKGIGQRLTGRVIVHYWKGGQLKDAIYLHVNGWGLWTFEKAPGAGVPETYRMNFFVPGETIKGLGTKDDVLVMTGTFEPDQINQRKGYIFDARDEQGQLVIMKAINDGRLCLYVWNDEFTNVQTSMPVLTASYSNKATTNGVRQLAGMESWGMSIPAIIGLNAHYTDIKEDLATFNARNLKLFFDQFYNDEKRVASKVTFFSKGAGYYPLLRLMMEIKHGDFGSAGLSSACTEWKAKIIDGIYYTATEIASEMAEMAAALAAGDNVIIQTLDTNLNRKELVQEELNWRMFNFAKDVAELIAYGPTFKEGVAEVLPGVESQKAQKAFEPGKAGKLTIPVKVDKVPRQAPISFGHNQVLLLPQGKAGLDVNIPVNVNGTILQKKPVNAYAPSSGTGSNADAGDELNEEEDITPVSLRQLALFDLEQTDAIAYNKDDGEPNLIVDALRQLAIDAAIGFFYPNIPAKVQRGLTYVQLIQMSAQVVYGGIDLWRFWLANSNLNGNVGSILYQYDATGRRLHNEVLGDAASSLSPQNKSSYPFIYQLNSIGMSTPEKIPVWLRKKIDVYTDGVNTGSISDFYIPIFDGHNNIRIGDDSAPLGYLKKFTGYNLTQYKTLSAIATAKPGYTLNNSFYYHENEQWVKNGKPQPISEERILNVQKEFFVLDHQVDLASTTQPPARLAETIQAIESTYAEVPVNIDINREDVLLSPVDNSIVNNSTGINLKLGVNYPAEMTKIKYVKAKYEIDLLTGQSRLKDNLPWRLISALDVKKGLKNFFIQNYYSELWANGNYTGVDYNSGYWLVESKFECKSASKTITITDLDQWEVVDYGIYAINRTPSLADPFVLPTSRTIDGAQVKWLPDHLKENEPFMQNFNASLRTLLIVPGIAKNTIAEKNRKDLVARIGSNQYPIYKRWIEEHEDCCSNVTTSHNVLYYQDPQFTDVPIEQYGTLVENAIPLPSIFFTSEDVDPVSQTGLRKSAKDVLPAKDRKTIFREYFDRFIRTFKRDIPEMDIVLEDFSGCLLPVIENVIGDLLNVYGSNERNANGGTTLAFRVILSNPNFGDWSSNDFAEVLASIERLMAKQNCMVLIYTPIDESNASETTIKLSDAGKHASLIFSLKYNPGETDVRNLSSQMTNSYASGVLDSKQTVVVFMTSEERQNYGTDPNRLLQFDLVKTDFMAPVAGTCFQALRATAVPRQPYLEYLNGDQDVSGYQSGNYHWVQAFPVQFIQLPSGSPLLINQSALYKVLYSPYVTPIDNSKVKFVRSPEEERRSLMLSTKKN